ncbi:MAG: hypothetical protein V2J12_13295 [Gammaproteobacteria bacterium]|jgi:hypothetical protein|nr:hypothetical protein [Gammaproteobacteria bacterium]
MRKNSLLPAAVLCAGLAGCSMTNQFNVAAIAASTEPLAAVSIFRKSPSPDFRAECAEHDNDSILKYCVMQSVDLDLLYAEFENSGAFAEVLFADQDVPYQIAIATARYSEDDVAGMGNAVVCGATLLLTPCSVDMEYRVEAGVYWFGILIAELKYELPFEQNLSLFSLAENVDHDAAESIASHIISDIQKSRLLSDELRISTLKSSDYFVGLRAPDELGAYSRLSTEIYDHPLSGVKLRYQHTDDRVDRTDVFVYPVRSTTWNESAVLLDMEAENVRSEIALFINETGSSEYIQRDSELWTLEAAGGPRKVLYFEGSYTDPQILDYVTRTYLAIVEDKFVKVRHTSLADSDTRNRTHEFAAAMISAIEVPGESIFMARVRQNWRSQGPLSP